MAIFSFLILLITMIMPFGGPLFIWELIRNGFYGEKMFITHNIPYDNFFIIWLNKFIGVAFWGSLVTCVMLIFFDKMDIRKKGKICLVCLIILLLIIFIPKIF